MQPQSDPSGEGPSSHEEDRPPSTLSSRTHQSLQGLTPPCIKGQHEAAPTGHMQRAAGEQLQAAAVISPEERAPWLYQTSATAAAQMMHVGMSNLMPQLQALYHQHQNLLHMQALCNQRLCDLHMVQGSQGISAQQPIIQQLQHLQVQCNKLFPVVSQCLAFWDACGAEFVEDWGKLQSLRVKQAQSGSLSQEYSLQQAAVQLRTLQSRKAKSEQHVMHLQHAVNAYHEQRVCLQQLEARANLGGLEDAMLLRKAQSWAVMTHRWCMELQTAAASLANSCHHA